MTVKNKKIKVADYLVRELNKLGVKDFFGLPGDYNFNILYAIDDNKNTKWVGCTNELNAGYAADGYARINGIGALVTTYGVGELSAMNAVAGSFAENIPVISIVGTPTTPNIKNNTLIHHNFQTPDYYAFQKAFEPIVETKRPVYVAVPMDVAFEPIEETEVEYSEISDKETLKSFINDATKLINNAEKPVIIGDCLVKRYFCEDEYKEFVQTSKIPTSNFLMGMGIIGSDKENYLGSYLADFGNDTANKYLTSTDCAISVGPIYSDLNTFSFALPYKPDDFIAIYGNYAVIGNKRYENIYMKDVLNELTKTVTKKDNIITVNDTGYKN